MLRCIPVNVLFVCSRNKKRSPTAEFIFSNLEGVNVLSAGTSVDAEHRYQQIWLNGLT